MAKKQHKTIYRRGRSPQKVNTPQALLEGGGHHVLAPQPTPNQTPYPFLAHANPKETQALFERLFESTPDANLLVNHQGKIVLANHQAEISFGYLRDEMINMSVEMLVPQDQREIHAVHRNRFQMAPRARPMGTGYELFALRKNGTRFPVDIILSPIQSSEGLLTLCVIHDITLQKANQQALQEQTALVRLLQEISTAANEAGQVLDLFQFAVDRLCAYLDWPIGHTFLVGNGNKFSTTHIWSSNFPEQLASFREASQEIQLRPGTGLPGTILSTGQPAWMTQPASRPNFYRKDAALQAGLNTALAFPVVIGKEVVAVMEFFSEQVVEPNAALMAILPNIGSQLGRVIERTRAEETLRRREFQLKTLISNLPVILWVSDTQGQITMFEGKGVAGIGMQPGEVVGESILERFETIPELKTYMLQAMKGETVRFQYKASTGAVFDTYFTPLLDPQGSTTGVIGMALDISERSRMEAELNEMRHYLMESVEIERLRLAQQLHDGPLQDLYGVFYQIQEVKNLLNGDSQQALDSPLQTIEHVNDTLRFICGELRPTTLVHLGLKRAITSHIERVREKHPDLSLHADLEDDAQSLEPNLRMGIYRIYQNLINNVIRHSQARHAWVRLVLRPERVTLEVQDNGQGFQVPENWISLVRQGRFGLAATEERVEALNGELEIRSRPETGTLVKVILPYHT